VAASTRRKWHSPRAMCDRRARRRDDDAIPQSPCHDTRSHLSILNHRQKGMEERGQDAVDDAMWDISGMQDV
jgi:hypothetical protein